MKMWEISAGRRGGKSRTLRVWGPEDSSLGALSMEFSTRYGIGVRGPGATPEELYAALTRTRDGEDRARADGLEGETVTELFVDWLVRQKGFSRRPDDGLAATPALKNP